MRILLDYSLKELEDIMLEMGEPKYRAKQLQDGLYMGKTINEISNISNELKEKLQREFISQPALIMDKKLSVDGTIKFIFRLYDKNIIESVLMKYEYGYTLCVSCQVGCKMNCTFCASGKDGFVRNLSSGEILGQVLQANKFLDGGIKDKRKITNIVMMGSGEPLDNYDNVIKFLHLVTNEFGISDRNISLSTSGLTDKIRLLASENLKITLTISLHASNDALRKTIMPIAKTYSMSNLMNAIKYYFEKTKRRVVFEYIVLPGINDLDVNAQELKKLMKNFSYHVNLIPYNSIDEENGQKTTHRQEAYNFAKKLEKMGISVTVRRTMGDDIGGACGQLRRKYLGNDDE